MAFTGVIAGGVVSDWLRPVEAGAVHHHAALQRHFRLYDRHWRNFNLYAACPPPPFLGQETPGGGSCLA